MIVTLLLLSATYMIADVGEEGGSVVDGDGIMLEGVRTGELNVVEEDSKQKGPDFLGVFHNTHLDIGLRYVTRYINQGVLNDDDSIQSQVRLSVDNPFFDESYQSRLFISTFTNFPIDGPLVEIDCFVGVTAHLFDVCDVVGINGEVGYNYCSYPNPPLEFQPVNRQNQFHGQLNAKWDKWTSAVSLYYEMALIQFTTIVTLVYETPLEDLVCIDCMPEGLSYLATLEMGYTHADRPNGDQGVITAIGGVYSYIEVGSYLKYALNKCAKIQTGVNYTANDAGASNYKEQESMWTWDVVDFVIAY